MGHSSEWAIQVNVSSLELNSNFNIEDVVWNPFKKKLEWMGHWSEWAQVIN